MVVVVIVVLGVLTDRTPTLIRARYQLAPDSTVTWRSLGITEGKYKRGPPTSHDMSQSTINMPPSSAVQRLNFHYLIVPITARIQIMNVEIKTHTHTPGSPSTNKSRSLELDRRGRQVIKIQYPRIEKRHGPSTNAYIYHAANTSPPDLPSSTMSSSGQQHCRPWS